jgi:hypothetical protein
MRIIRWALAAAVLAMPATGGTIDVDFVVRWTTQGDHSNDTHGQALACGGDFDGDGIGDVAVYERDWSGGTPFDTGVVRVFSGATGSQIHYIRGPAENAEYGRYGLDFVPDLDGDGCDELAVSYVKDGTNGSYAGRVDVISGKTHQKIRSLYGDGTADQFGSSLALAGDVDADGTADILVGSPYHRVGGVTRGLARVHSGKDGSVIWSIVGESGDFFGYDVAGAGDVDADGHDDILVGAPKDGTAGAQAGAALVYSGRDGALLHTLLGENPGEQAGTTVAGLGDVDGDGCDDVLVGSPNDSAAGDHAGGVSVWSGRTGNRIEKLVGDAVGDVFGLGLASIGDVDFDGVPDFAVGAPGNDALGDWTGQVKVYSGADRRALETLLGGTAGEAFGYQLAGGGDVNGDGVPDFAVTSQSWRLPTNVSVGRVTVYETTVQSGHLVIDGGALCTGDTGVDLLVVRPNGTWGEMRLRNAGGTWSDWTAFDPHVPFTLPEGEGEKTVEAELRDGGGTLLGPITDSIYLDLTPPGGSVTIDGGKAFTRMNSVTLALSMDDDHADAGTYRARTVPRDFGFWRAFVESRSWVVGPTDGLYTVEVQYRDLAGNTGPAVSAAVTLDTTAPSGAFSLALGRDYVFWNETVLLEVSAVDGAGGSGLEGLQVSFDDGSIWGSWLPIGGAGPVEVARPPVQGTRVLRARVRDLAGNLAELGSAKTVFLGPDLPALRPAAKQPGLFAPEVCAQAYRVGLVAGDLFGAKLKATSSGTAPLVIHLDLLAPDRSVLVTGRFPATAKAPGISAFPVPETGEYTLVLRTTLQGGAPSGTFLLSLSTKQGKANRGGSGTMDGEPILFDAVAGSLFKASLARPGLTAADVTLTGPSGPLSFSVKEGNGKVAILPVALDQATGTWRLTVAGPGAVQVKYSVKLPK